jgi:UDP-N-acetylglucosamine--N-acetylmuramyl-(pentapeptide) pyrophosphoryl-undecaprenol N-acetylglucosamine transferase
MGDRVVESRNIRVVIAGGGTGGHVLPAVSVIEELMRREIAVEYLWIGSPRSVEQSAAERHGIRFAAIATGKLRRYKDVKNIVDIARVPVGLLQSFRLLHAFKPDVIFSTGGFVSVPTVVAGARIAPILTHEQTTTIGLATKINGRFADVLALSYEQSRSQVSGKAKVIVTGNPVRLSLLNGDASKALAHFGFDASLPMLYVTGGARGSSPINHRIEQLLPELLEHCQILHQTGPADANGDAARLRILRDNLPPDLRRRYVVTEFVRDELKDVYAAAALVLARSGAGMIAELPLVGKPALFIPLPNTSGHEQDRNARLLADAGAAVVLPQSEATPDRLRTELLALISDRERLNTMADNSKAVACPGAAARLADELLALSRQQS